MSLSIQKMVSDGTLSTIALGVQYLQRNDIYMRIDGVETPQSGAPSGYTWSFLDNNTIRVLPVVPAGVEVVVYRRTDLDAMYNIYSQNAQFDESTIDENNQQLLYIAQEYFEQGVPAQLITSVEYTREDTVSMYYRLKLSDGSYTAEFAVPKGGAEKYPELQMSRWRDEHDIRGWGAKSGVDASQAANDAINSGINSLYIPEGEWTFDSSIQLPDRDFTLYGAGRGSILRGSAAQIVKYPASASGFQNVHSLKFIVGANHTAIQMHKIWTTDGKEEVQVTGCHFYTNATGVTFISVKGIWSGRIQNNEMFGTSRANDTYGIKLVTDDNMNSSVMNLDISNNKEVLVAYPVYYAGKTLSSGGRVEGVSIGNNKLIAGKTGVRLAATNASLMTSNLIHDFDDSAIELNGDFDFVINGNVELNGGVQAILLQSTVGSILERGVINGNKIAAGNLRVGVLIRTVTNAPRSIAINGNTIGRTVAGEQTGTGVKVDSTAAVHNISICGNVFQNLDTAIDRGAQAGDIVTLGNSYAFVTNTGAGMQSTPFTKSMVITLTGGAVSEVLTVDLPAGVTNKRPQFAMALGTGTGVTSAQSVVGFYDLDNSTATQLKFNLMRIDRAVMTAGTIRVHIMANLF